MADRPDDRDERAARDGGDAHARREDDGHDDGAPPPIRPAPPVSVCGLEVGLLDVGRFVALNGYADACKLLPFLSRDFLREDDFLIATKHVRYGGKQRTRLMSLARKGDEVRVARLLRVSADIKAQDSGGRTALHSTCAKGHESVIRLLLDGGAEVGAADAVGNTPLHVASSEGREPVVRLLIARGADVNAVNEEYETPLHVAARKGHWGVVAALAGLGADMDEWGTPVGTVLDLAVDAGDIGSVRLLLDLGANVDGAEDTKANPIVGCTPLFHAVWRGHEAIVRLLLEKGAHVNATRQEDGSTPLLEAAESGNEGIMRALVAAGAHVDATDNKKFFSALEHAIERNDVASARVLLELGADIGDTDDAIGIPSLLFRCIWEGRTEIVELLIEKGANVNAVFREDGSTPLHAACQGGHEAMMRALVAKGAHLWTRDDDGSTALDLAEGRNDVASARVLLELGASVGDPNDSDCWPSPLLFRCIWEGRTEIVHLLIARGANVNAVLEDGRSTPLHEACERGQEAIMRALVGAGAHLWIEDAYGSTPLGRVPAGAGREAFVRTFEEVAEARERVERAAERAADRARRANRFGGWEDHW
jgi:ankyrin repeat protein